MHAEQQSLIDDGQTTPEKPVTAEVVTPPKKRGRPAREKQEKPLEIKEPEEPKLPAMVEQGLATEDDGTDVSYNQLKENLKQAAKIQQLLDKFIKENLKEGVDYGFAYDKAKKYTLLKPGAEKVCLLFNMDASYELDKEIMALLPEAKAKDTICFVCNLRNRKTGNLVGQGRGSATISETYGQKVNNTIKIAQKRAKIDAVLNTAGLSDRFTQDMGGASEQEDGAEQGLTKDGKTIIGLLKEASGIGQYNEVVRDMQVPGKYNLSKYDIAEIKKFANTTLARLQPKK